MCFVAMKSEEKQAAALVFHACGLAVRQRSQQGSARGDTG